MAFRSRSDGSHYPLRGRSLYDNRLRSKTYQRNIHFGNETQARESVTFANQKWENSSRSERVHLLRAMNEARNKARVASHNSRLSESERHQASEADRTLTAWIDSHKGREGGNQRLSKLQELDAQGKLSTSEHNELLKRMEERDFNRTYRRSPAYRT